MANIIDYRIGNYDYRIGNYVDFKGVFGEYPMSRIIAINTREDWSIFNYTLTHPEEEEFVGYIEHSDLRQILLKPEHMEKLGFRYDKKYNHFNLHHLTVSYESFGDYTDPQNPVGVFPSMRIYKPMADIYNLQKKLAVDHFAENTVHIGTLHIFQNYCEDQGLKIDFSVLESKK